MFLVFHRTYLMPRGVFDDIIRDHAGWKLAALREDENSVKISRKVQAGSEASSRASACEKKTQRTMRIRWSCCSLESFGLVVGWTGYPSAQPHQKSKPWCMAG